MLRSRKKNMKKKQRVNDFKITFVGKRARKLEFQTSDPVESLIEKGTMCKVRNQSIFNIQWIVILHVRLIYFSNKPIFHFDTHELCSILLMTEKSFLDHCVNLRDIIEWHVANKTATTKSWLVR